MAGQMVAESNDSAETMLAEFKKELMDMAERLLNRTVSVKEGSHEGSIIMEFLGTPVGIITLLMLSLTGKILCFQKDKKYPNITWNVMAALLSAQNLFPTLSLSLM